MDAEIIKVIPDLVTASAETQSCHLEVNQENDMVLEEPNTKEPSTQSSKGEPFNTLVEIPYEIKMQVITSDISTVAADQLTPVLNQNQKAEELN